MEEALPGRADRRQNRGFILGSLTFGHAVAHLYDHGFPVFMPVITSAMRLSTLQVAGLLGVRQAGFGGVNLGAGIFVDLLSNQWGLILAACMVLYVVSYVALGASLNYAMLIVSVILLSVPGALWHLPATAALSQRFPDRRGFAISMHGLGSNSGNVVGPVVAGALLSLFYWRNVLLIYSTPALLVAWFVWWSLKNVGREEVRPDSTEGRTERKRLGAQLREAGRLLRNPVILGLVVVAAVRGVGLNALFHWTPFYLEEELLMGHLRTGVYFALLTGSGIFAAPVFGILSDRFGRKAVLLPGLVGASAFSLLVVAAGDGILLAAALAGIGLFSFSLQQIVLAAVLDVSGKGTEATATGLIFGLNGAAGAATPFLATVIIDQFGGYGATFYYSGALTAVAAVIVLLLPWHPSKVVEANPA